MKYPLVKKKLFKFEFRSLFLFTPQNLTHSFNCEQQIDENDFIEDGYNYIRAMTGKLIG